MAYAVTLGTVQKDGRRWVVEVHSDGQGQFARIEYLCPVGANTDTIASARDTQLVIDYADNEALSALDVDAMPTLRFQTAGQFRTRIRNLYKISSAYLCCKIARWIIRRIAAGDVTDAQMQNAFNLTANQWTTLKTKMQNLAADLDGVETSVGE